MTTMQDSGQRQGFDTGAVRDTAEGKPLYDLISPIFWLELITASKMGHVDFRMPVRKAVADLIQLWREGRRDKPYLALAALCLYGFHLPALLLALAARLEVGARKYSARNWERGIPLSRSCQSLLRHEQAHAMERIDEDHRAAMVCNMMFLVHTEEMVTRGLLPAELNDLPIYVDRAPSA